MQFLNENSLNDAIAARIELARKRVLIGADSADSALRIDDLGVVTA